MEKEFTLTKQHLPEDGEILVIEDDVESLRFIEIILEREGIKYISSPNAAQAINIYNGKEHNIQAVISDVVLSDNSGIGISRDIHSNNSDIPFLFASNVEDPYTSNLLWQHGMVYHKPFKEDFPAVVRRLIMCANNQTGMFGIKCRKERRKKHRRDEDVEI